MPSADMVVIEPDQTATASVIWLHGLGADGHDFEPIVPELGGAITREVRFIFPHAPPRPVTINGGYVMRAWYDITEMDLAQGTDVAGVRESDGILRTYIEAEIRKGISIERIVLAGFSQGGAIALHTGLRFPHRLAGILALSTYLPLPESAAEEAEPVNAAIPIFMAHGRQDPIIGIGQAERSKELLTSLGYGVEWHTYPMPHAVCPDEIGAISAWLTSVLEI